MPIGQVKGNALDVITERSDLGYGRGKGGNWWALRAFGAMCDEQVDLPYPYTLWRFPVQIRLAVERVLKERGRELEVVGDKEFNALLSRIIRDAKGENWRTVSE